MGQELLLPCQNVHCEAPRLQGGASRKGNFILIVPLDPAYPAETGRGTCRPNSYILSRFLSRSPTIQLTFPCGSHILPLKFRPSAFSRLT
jgi:hypothetical protein